MHIALFLKVTYWIQILLKKIHISKWTKIEISLSVIGVKFPREKKKKNFNKVLLVESTLPWATPCLGPCRFFLNEKKYFSTNAYCFIFKSDLLNLNFVEKKNIFYTVFLEKLLFRWAK